MGGWLAGLAGAWVVVGSGDGGEQKTQKHQQMKLAECSKIRKLIEV